MTDTFAALKAPAPEEGLAWFQDIAALLLNRAALLVDGAPHRLREIEFYYNSEAHADPFAHGAEQQKTVGRWYFHREGGEYRGGSFKGLDISFGPEGVVGGVLIRTLDAPDGAQVNGCSLCVDHLLAQTGHERVAALDGALGSRHVWEAGGPLQLVEHEWEDGDILGTARVGLTLKRMYEHLEMPAYLMRPYRFLTDHKIKKGKIHTIMALHKRGEDAATIKKLTGANASALTKYIEAYNEGREREDFNSYRGRDWSTEDLCSIHGTWDKLYGG